MIRIILLLLIATSCSGQTLEQRIGAIEAALDSSHQEFKSGTVCIAAGSTLALVGALLPVKGGEWDYWKITSVSFGSALLTLGTVLYIDSHKYLGRLRPIPGGVALRIGKP